jgi:predicted TIM-barrel fold metal-dependent hydrolase
MLSRRDLLAGGVGMLSYMREASPLLVDSHVHVWTHDPQYPFAVGATVPPIDATAESLLTRMRENGVDSTVLIQVIHYKWDNAYLVATLRRYPEKFAGVCRVNPEDPAAPDHLSRLTEDGCHGVRLSPATDASGDWIRGELMPPLWKRCAELKIPMTLLLPVSRLADVTPLIEKHPELKVVIDHMADCPVDDRSKLAQLIALSRYPGVFVKISHMWSLSQQAYPYADASAMVARVRDAFGAERLMWGTDWPIRPELVSYADRISLYRNARNTPFFSTQERGEVLYRTARRVWSF